MSAFKGQAQVSGANGEGGEFPRPSQDVHEARLVALVDLGTHTDAFPGKPPKDRRKLFIVFELDEKNPQTGERFLIGQEYTLSFYDTSNLRQMAEMLLDRKYGDEEIDYSRLLGAPCAIKIEHKPRPGKSPAAVIKQVSALPKSRRKDVFKPTHPVFSFDVNEDAVSSIPEWLEGRICFGKTLIEKIEASHEHGGKTTTTTQAAAGKETGVVAALERARASMNAGAAGGIPAQPDDSELPW